MKNKTAPQVLEVTISDEYVVITRNYTQASILAMDKNKGFIALADAIANPGKYNLYIHDLRQSDVYSNLTFALEKKAEDV